MGKAGPVVLNDLGPRRAGDVIVPDWMRILARPCNWLEDHGPLGRTADHARARRDRDIAAWRAANDHGVALSDIAAVMDINPAAAARAVKRGAALSRSERDRC